MYLVTGFSRRHFGYDYSYSLKLKIAFVRRSHGEFRQTEHCRVIFLDPTIQFSFKCHAVEFLLERCSCEMFLYRFVDIEVISRVRLFVENRRFL